MTPREEAKPKKPVSTATRALAGAVSVAGLAIVVAQRNFGEVRESVSLTLIIVAAGLVVGAVIGVLAPRIVGRMSSP